MKTIFRFRSPMVVLTLLLGVVGASYGQAPAAKGDITKAEQTVADIPRELLLGLRPGANMEESATKATAITRKTAEGKTAVMKFVVRDIEKFQRRDEPTVDRFRVKGEVERLREGVTTFQVYLMAVPDVSEHPKLEKLKKGSQVTITGKISNVEIIARQSPELHIDIIDAKVK